MDTLANMDKFEARLCEKSNLNKTPISGAIELLPLCNMDCEMCYIRLTKDQVNAGGGLRSADEWIEIGKQMKEQGTLFILLTGGEPFLYKDFDKLYNALRNMGMILTINTNGTLIDEKIADMLSKNKPRRVNITLYGASNETYKKLCKNPNGFDQTINAIKLLKERDIDVKMNVSVVEENKNDLAQIIKISGELGVPVSIDTYMFPKTKGKREDFKYSSRITPKEVANIDISISYNTKTEEEFMKDRLEFLGKYEWYKNIEKPDEIPMLCRAGRSSFWLDWRGNMSPCVFLEDINMNVFESEFSKCWDHIIKESSKLFMPKGCVSCNKKEICQVCIASVYCENGNLEKSPSYLCELTNEKIRILR